MTSYFRNICRRVSNLWQFLADLGDEFWMALRLDAHTSAACSFSPLFKAGPTRPAVMAFSPGLVKANALQWVEVRAWWGPARLANLSPTRSSKIYLAGPGRIWAVCGVISVKLKPDKVQQDFSCRALSGLSCRRNYYWQSVGILLGLVGLNKTTDLVLVSSWL